MADCNRCGRVFDAIREPCDCEQMERVSDSSPVAGYPSWWPENPYPESVFTMKIKDYVEAIPDGKLRTAISGCLGRMFWDMASKAILEAKVAHENQDGARLRKGANYGDV